VRYPTLPRAVTRQLAQEFLESGDRSIDDDIKWEGSGEDLDLSGMEPLGDFLKKRLKEFEGSERAKDIDRFEGIAAGEIHRALQSVPLEILDDPGFWRYLTMSTFFWLPVWRQRSTFESLDPSKYLKYIDGVSSTECVLTRMFLRGQIACVDGSYDLAFALSRSTDFWRSHILRVSTGSSPSVARSLVIQQATSQMKTDPLRKFARRLNRLSSNVALPMYGDAEAKSLISDLIQGN